jgi:hypothetical protein
MVHLFAVATLLLSQQLDTSIFGIVRDDTGATLSGAAVSIQHVETGAERKLATDGNGRYSAPSVGGVFGGFIVPGADGGHYHIHGHHVAADSVRPEAVVVAA